MRKTAGFLEIAKAMAKMDVCMMQTFKGNTVHSRPMSNNGDVEYDGDNWFFARASSNKVAEIADNPKVQLLFGDPKTMAFISVWGKASVIENDEKKKELWHDELSQWFSRGPEDSQVVLIRVRADKIQSWGSIGDHELNA